MSEIEKIRERAQRANQLVASRDDTPALGMTTRTYAADVAYLLKRVEELEAENEKPARDWSRRMNEGRQYKRWILLDKGNLHIKESVEHPGHGWADLTKLLERIAELEVENEQLRLMLNGANKRLLGEDM